MPTFYNQATLSYNGNTVSSNVVQGEIVAVLSAAKTPTVDSYSQNDTVTYAVSLVNSGTTAYTGLTVSDDLGAYEYNTATVYPLDYIEGSVRYFINGVLQPAPAVASVQPLVISGISVPAGGDAIILYSAKVNAYASPEADGQVTNTVTVTGSGISTPVAAEATVAASTEAVLDITKALSPSTVAENGQLTYTFVISNYGPAEAVETDNIVVSDTFDPIINPITVVYNGVTWEEVTNYTYDETTGDFATVAGQITVPAATYVQDTATGEWVITPGTSTLTVTGTV